MTPVAAMLSLLATEERRGAATLRRLAEHHPDEAEIVHTVAWMAPAGEERADAIDGLLVAKEQYGADDGEEGRVLNWPGGRSPPSGFALLTELRDTYREMQAIWTGWVVARQGALATRDHRLLELCDAALPETERRAKWLLTSIKQTAPQALGQPPVEPPG